MRLPRDYIRTPVGMHRNRGRLAGGMPVGMALECRSASERNRGRHGPDSAAKYNEGRLVGIWIDLPAYDLWEQVEEMLNGDEEWAIHDYEAPFSTSAPFHL